MAGALPARLVVSGPSAAIAATRVALRDALRRADATRLVVAVSGGADSLALAGAAAYHQRDGLETVAVVVDHGLQVGSRGVAERAAEQCRGLGLTAHVESVAVVDTHDGPESAARSARYAALEAFAGEVAGSVVVLGHTRDDQAEQVLLALARGSGTRSLAGIPVRRGVFLRPFLRTGRGSDPGVTRAVTRAACAELGLVPWDDPHNDDPRFLRARLRRALPLLANALGPEGAGLARALARTADLARADTEALDILAEQRAGAYDASGWSVPLLAAEPEAIRRRILRILAHGSGAEALGLVHVEALDALVISWHGQGPVDLPGGVRVARRGNTLVLV